MISLTSMLAKKTKHIEVVEAALKKAGRQHHARYLDWREQMAMKNLEANELIALGELAAQAELEGELDIAAVYRERQCEILEQPVQPQELQFLETHIWRFIGFWALALIYSAAVWFGLGWAVWRMMR
jgi:hypothetical protein